MGMLSHSSTKGSCGAEKVAWVSIMGGLRQEDGEWVADSAQNNVFDKAASARVYGFCLQRYSQAAHNA